MKKQILTSVVMGSLVVLAPGMSVNAAKINQMNEQVTIVESNSKQQIHFKLT